MRAPLREPLWTRLKSKKVVIPITVGVIGLASALLTLSPRLQVDVDPAFDPASPFPGSISVTNTGNFPLANVSIFVRPCRIVDETGSVVGVACNGLVGSGGITMPDWRDHYLGVGVKWTIPMGRNIPFQFNANKADILVVVSYLPWPLSVLRFVPPQETAAHFVTHREPDGRVIWISRPVD